MKITLIFPKHPGGAIVLPMGLAYLKSNMPSEHNLNIIDCNIEDLSAESCGLEQKLKELNPDVVGVSVAMSMTSWSLYASRARARNMSS